MKKMISVIMVVCIMICSFGMSVSANSATNYIKPEVSLMNLYTDNIQAVAYKDGSRVFYK